MDARECNLLAEYVLDVNPSDGVGRCAGCEIAKLSSLRTEDIRNARPTRPRMQITVPIVEPAQ